MSEIIKVEEVIWDNFPEKFYRSKKLTYGSVFFGIIGITILLVMAALSFYAPFMEITTRRAWMAPIAPFAGIYILHLIFKGFKQMPLMWKIQNFEFPHYGLNKVGILLPATRGYKLISWKEIDEIKPLSDKANLKLNSVEITTHKQKAANPFILLFNEKDTVGGFSLSDKQRFLDYSLRMLQHD